MVKGEASQIDDRASPTITPPNWASLQQIRHVKDMLRFFEKMSL